MLLVDLRNDCDRILNFYFAEDSDDEVSELTSSSRSNIGGHPATVTAESVKMFMKKVNRIRFNSLTAANNTETSGKKIGGKHRSRSCPQFPKIETMSEEEEELSRSASTICNDGSATEMSVTDAADGKTDFEVSASQETEPNDNITLSQKENRVTVKSKEEITVTITSTKSREVTVSKCPMYSRSERGSEERCDEGSDLIRILRQVLNTSSGAVCSKCEGRMEGAPSGEYHDC